jgi:hypothetical protein
MLGVDNPDAYSDRLMSAAKREAPSCDIGLIRPPVSDDEEEHQNCSNFILQFQQVSLEGLFVKSGDIPHRSTYVDVVQKHAQPVQPLALERKPETSPYPTVGTRKVSNASTVSTQAEELPDWSYPYESFEHEWPWDGDMASVGSEWETSELTMSTKERKIRMESRKKDAKAKKSEFGLLAVVPCPREEPDRSTPYPTQSDV